VSKAPHTTSHFPPSQTTSDPETAACPQAPVTASLQSCRSRSWGLPVRREILHHVSFGDARRAYRRLPKHLSSHRCKQGGDRTASEAHPGRVPAILIAPRSGTLHSSHAFQLPRPANHTTALRVSIWLNTALLSHLCPPLSNATQRR
jgi:hypothetical protein